MKIYTTVQTFGVIIIIIDLFIFYFISNKQFWKDWNLSKVTVQTFKIVQKILFERT